MGASTSGIKNYIEQLYKAVQHKVDRDDIRAMINSKIEELESDLLQKEDDLYSVASSTRCLSCGVGSRSIQSGAPLKPLKKGITPGVSSNSSVDHSVIADQVSISTDITNHSFQNMQNDGGSQSNSTQSRPRTIAHVPDIHVLSASDEEVQSLLSGTAGLKPILKHIIPVLDVTPSNRQKKNADKSSDPVYRKAKAAQYMKEMVKINESTANFYSLKNNSPVYILEDDSQSVGNGSLASHGSVSLPHIRNGESSKQSVNTKQNNPMSLSISSSKLNTYF